MSSPRVNDRDVQTEMGKNLAADLEVALTNLYPDLETRLYVVLDHLKEYLGEYIFAIGNTMGITADNFEKLQIPPEDINQLLSQVAFGLEGFAILDSVELTAHHQLSEEKKSSFLEAYRIIAFLDRIYSDNVFEVPLPAMRELLDKFYALFDHVKQINGLDLPLAEMLNVLLDKILPFLNSCNLEKQSIKLSYDLYVCRRRYEVIQHEISDPKISEENYEDKLNKLLDLSLSEIEKFTIISVVYYEVVKSIPVRYFDGDDWAELSYEDPDAQENHEYVYNQSIKKQKNFHNSFSNLLRDHANKGSVAASFWMVTIASKITASWDASLKVFLFSEKDYVFFIEKALSFPENPGIKPVDEEAKAFLNHKLAVEDAEIRRNAYLIAQVARENRFFQAVSPEVQKQIVAHARTTNFRTQEEAEAIAEENLGRPQVSRPTMGL